MQREIEEIGVDFHMMVTRTFVGNGGTKATLDKLKAWKLKGVSFGPDSTGNSESATSRASVAELDAELALTLSYLTTNGLDGPGNALGCWANGHVAGESATANGNPAMPGLTQLTGVESDGTDVIKVAASTGMSVGDILTGIDFDGRPTVKAIVDGTHLQMSRAIAARAARPAAIIKAPGRFYMGVLPAIFRARGVKMMRDTLGTYGGRNFIGYGLGDAQDMAFTGYSMSNATTAAVDDIIAKARQGFAIMTYIHQVIEGYTGGSIHVDKVVGDYFQSKIIEGHKNGWFTVLNGDGIINMTTRAKLPLALRTA